MALAEQDRLPEGNAIARGKKKKLTVRSPIDGKVITLQLEDAGNRPVESGDQLLEVIDPTGDWELEVRMPEDRMGHIKKAQHEIKPI